MPDRLGMLRSAMIRVGRSASSTPSALVGSRRSAQLKPSLRRSLSLRFADERIVLHYNDYLSAHLISPRVLSAELSEAP